MSATKPTRKFRLVLAGTEASLIIDALRDHADRMVQGSATRIMARHLADRLTIEFANWLEAQKAVKP